MLYFRHLHKYTLFSSSPTNLPSPIPPLLCHLQDAIMHRHKIIFPSLHLHLSFIAPSNPPLLSLLSCQYASLAIFLLSFSLPLSLALPLYLSVVLPLSPYLSLSLSPLYGKNICPQ